MLIAGVSVVITKLMEILIQRLSEWRRKRKAKDRASLLDYYPL